MRMQHWRYQIICFFFHSSYTHVFLCRGLVVFHRQWSGTGDWRVCVCGGGAQRSLIHAHLLSLCSTATPEPATRNSMWRQSGEIIRAPLFGKWREIYQWVEVRVLGVVLNTHSVGEDVIYQSLFSCCRQENFFCTVSNTRYVRLEYSRRSTLHIRCCS